MDTLDISSKTALQWADALRRRELSSVELVGAALERAEASEIGAFVEIARPSALKAAAAADKRLAAGGDFPRFLGVPTGIKDHEHVAWMGTRAGAAALSWVRAPFDSGLAKRCRKGGFVLTGKLATSELTILPFIDVGWHPPTRNPAAPHTYAGGSSGGSAAAVAGGLLPIAPGSDGAGSIRIPASFCGLIGIKPGRGVVLHEHTIVDRYEISAIGPLARTVADAAAMLDVMAGDYTHRDTAPEGSFLTALTATPGPLRVRVGLQSPLVEVHPEIAAAVRRVGETLASMGHSVSEIGPFDGGLSDFLPFFSRLMSQVPVPPWSESKLLPTSRWMRKMGRSVKQSEARRVLEDFQPRIQAWQGEADVLVFPTVAQPPPRVGSFDGLDGEQTFHAAAIYGAFTAVFNASGQPAGTLPVGRDSGGHPMGVQIVTRRGQDRLLISVMARLEEALA